MPRFELGTSGWKPKNVAVTPHLLFAGTIGIEPISVELETTIFAVRRSTFLKNHLKLN